MGLRVVELFAGVGGFRLGLEKAGHRVVWSNQWEPGKRSQHASDCYVRHFGADGHSNEDIAEVPTTAIPDHDLLVGGFPCQDYSVATTKARGIEGKKGVLWWEIDRIVKAKRPPYLLLENVDRLLKSPTEQRGRDFAVLLASLGAKGYRVEWRVLNAADHGFPQKRRRTFIFAARDDTPWGASMAAHAADADYLGKGFFGTIFPILPTQTKLLPETAPNAVLPQGIQQVSDAVEFRFPNAGVLVGRRLWCDRVDPRPQTVATLGSILQPDAEEQYHIPKDKVERWRYLKGAKAEKRKAANGYEYHYTEGAIPFPDDLDQPSRTLMTGEGGTSPSRFNHIVKDPQTRRYRILTPIEAERLNGFPDGWTEGMPERWRYFTMGNALVVGLVERMGHSLAGGPSNRRLMMHQARHRPDP
jgi:DNA (cytosine-5)-methyltransferase 1